MKKLLTLLFCALLAVSAMAITPWDGTAAAAFAGGSGTSIDPYQIATAEQLAYLASQANATQTANVNTAGKYYQLTADIDLNGPTYSWTPIGIATATAFAGVFDGDNHIISNIYINNATTLYAGLFGYPTGTSSKNVIIKNLIVASGSITVTNSGSTAGAFAGRSIYAQFINCKNAINVKGINSVAGIVGTFGSATTTGIIEYCSNSGTITCAGAGLHVGGIAGNAVTASGVSYIRYCYNTGAVTAISNAGGIAGSASGAILTIKECFNKGIISSVNTDAGGIVGLGYGASFNVSNCYNTAVVKQTSSSASSSLNGGILGYPGGTGTDKYFQAITNCYNTGAVTATKTGGTVEAIAGALKGSTATGTGYVTNSYYLSTLTLTNTNGGTSKLASELQDAGFITLLENGQTPSAWASDATNLNGGYPILAWQSTYSVLTAPTANAATSITTTGCTANWTTVAGAVNYIVKVYDATPTLKFTFLASGAAATSLALNGLTTNVTYTYKVTAVGNSSTFDSPESAASASFGTGMPVLDNTSTPTQLTSTSVTVSGNVTSDGGASISARGVCWGITSNPTISAPNTVVADATAGLGTFTETITGLEAGTAYYVRAYATNATKTNYGTQVSFKILSTPTVSDATALNATGFTANWTAVTSASSYDVNVYQETSLIKTLNASGQATASLAITGLTSETAYTYTVVAKGDGISTLNSAESAVSNSVTTSTATALNSVNASNSISVIGKTIVANETGNLQIFNLQGAQILQYKAVNKAITNLSQGIYIIRFTNTKGKQTVQKISIL